MCIYVSRCAARITRHRAFSSGTLQLSIIIFILFQASLLRSAADKSAKNEQCCSRFSRFCDVRIMIFRYFWGSGQPVLSILRLSENLSYFSVFGDLPAAKNYFLFAPKSRLGLTFRGLVLYCFGVPVFSIFYDLGCPKIQLWLPFWLYFESFGPLGKQLKVL